MAITTEQTKVAATGFLEHVVDRLPYRVEAVLPDNALAFEGPGVSDRYEGDSAAIVIARRT